MELIGSSRHLYRAGSGKWPPRAGIHAPHAVDIDGRRGTGIKDCHPVLHKP